jgi:hypothetical protein
MHVDNDHVRTQIPKAKYPSAAFIVKYVKSVIGLDVNKLNVPVNINAPMSVLQIGAEANLVNH